MIIPTYQQGNCSPIQFFMVTKIIKVALELESTFSGYLFSDLSTTAVSAMLLIYFI